MCRAATGGPDAFRGTSMKQLIFAVCAALALTFAVPAGAAAQAPATPAILSVTTFAPADAGPQARAATYLDSLLGTAAIEQHRGGRGGRGGGPRR